MVVRRKFENQKKRIKMPSIQTKYRELKTPKPVKEHH